MGMILTLRVIACRIPSGCEAEQVEHSDHETRVRISPWLIYDFLMLSAWGSDPSVSHFLESA